MSARDLARMVQEGLQKLPIAERQEFFALVSPLQAADRKAIPEDESVVIWPDQQARLTEILGDKVLSFNPVLEERETSRW